jgi:aerobic carbon-monoxide dehydrogenase small subunit
VPMMINGREAPVPTDARVSLLDFLREHLELYGSKKGCNQGACGACTVLVDGERVLSCLALAVQYEDREVTTIEGLSSGGSLHPLQQAFIDHHGLQCGFCTPGFLMLAAGVLERDPNISDDDLLDLLASNLCRCTGYQNIVKAVRAAAVKMGARR